MEQALLDVAPQLITVGAALLIALAGWGIKVLKSKVNFEAGKAALDEVDRAVKTVVGNISQTTAKAWKAAAQDGKLTAEEKASLKRLAQRDAVNLISAETAKAANKIVTDFGGYLAKKIEEQVLANKAQNPGG